MDFGPVDLFSQQELNRRRSRRLVAGFVLFFAWLGFGGDLIAMMSTADAAGEAYRHSFPWLGVGMTLLGVGMAWTAWRKGTQQVLWSSGAWELLNPAGEEQTRLVNVVEEMAIAAGLPRPRIFIVSDPDPNAFAAGRGPESACIAVTEGLLRLCSRDELQAVVAHEMGHIKNLDVRLMTLLTGLLGAVVLLRDGVLRAIRTARVPSARARGGKQGSPVVLVLLALWLASWLLAPLVARLMVLGVSRKREFLADAMSAQFTRNPLALAAALEKIERCHDPTTSLRDGCAHLCIADPRGRTARVAGGGWLATHPPMQMRVSRLKAMAYQGLKRAGAAAPAA